MNNKLIIEKKDIKKEYKILFKVDVEQHSCFLVYSAGEKNKEGETICYAGEYSKMNGHQTIEPIKDDYTLEFLDSILLQVQNKMNK